MSGRRRARDPAPPRAQDGGCLYLISGGEEGSGPSCFGDASESGEDVFFFTAQRLVGQDHDQLVDVYDARVDGGLAAQDPGHADPLRRRSPAAGPERPPVPPARRTASTPAH